MVNSQNTLQTHFFDSYHRVTRTIDKDGKIYINYIMHKNDYGYCSVMCFENNQFEHY